MDEKKALAVLARKFDKGGIKAIREFAAEIGVPFHTVYNWHRVKKVPSWRLTLFDKAA
jgi:hypothetical protein